MGCKNEIKPFKTQTFIHRSKIFTHARVYEKQNVIISDFH